MNVLSGVNEYQKAQTNLEDPIVIRYCPNYFSNPCHPLTSIMLMMVLHFFLLPCHPSAGMGG